MTTWGACHLLDSLQTVLVIQARSVVFCVIIIVSSCQPGPPTYPRQGVRLSPKGDGRAGPWEYT